MVARQMLALALVAAGAAAPLAAQSDVSGEMTSAQLAPGTRVKFSMLDVGSGRTWADRRLVVRGKLTDVRTDSLVLEMGGTAGRMTVARSALVDLSVSQGMQRAWRAHPGRTALNGALFATGLALLARGISQQSSSNARMGSANAMMATSVGLSGFIFARSAFGRVERWETVK